MNNFMSIVLILFVVGILFSLVYDQNLPEKDKVKIPENCAIWFDGCNTCHVSEHGLEMCTLKLCKYSEMQTPKCLEYKN